MISRFFRSYGTFFFLIVSLGVLAFPSLFLWVRSVHGGCAWQLGWLSCQVPKSVGQVWWVAGILITVFGFWAFVHKKILSQEQFLSSKMVNIFFPILAVLACIIVPLGSSDLTYYRSAGQAITHGINPFVTVWPRSYVFGGEGLPDTTVHGFSYGPLTADLFVLVELISRGNVFFFFLVWKILMVATLFGVSWLLSFLLRKNGDVSRDNVYLILSPILLFEWLTNGHFDGLWVISVLLGILFARQKRWVYVAGVLTIGIWLKFLPLFTTPWFLLWWWQDTRGQMGERVKHVLLGGGVTAILTVVAWAPYWTGREVFTPIILQSKWAVMSLFSTLYYGLSPLALSLFGGGYHWYLTRAVQGSLAVLFLWFVWPLIKKAWQALFFRTVWGEREVVVSITIFFLAYLMVWQKSFWPWYAAWLLPFIWYVVRENILRLPVVCWVYLISAPIFFYPLWFVGNLIAGKDPTPLWWFGALITVGVWGYPFFLLTRYRIHHESYE